MAEMPTGGLPEPEAGWVRPEVDGGTDRTARGATGAGSGGLDGLTAVGSGGGSGSLTSGEKRLRVGWGGRTCGPETGAITGGGADRGESCLVTAGGGGITAPERGAGTETAGAVGFSTGG